MTEPHFFWLILSLLFLLGKTRASCIIPKDTMSTNHVFLSFENNVWDLLHSDIVPATQSIYLLCDDGNLPKQFDCDGFISPSFNPALPTTNCAKSFKQTIIEDKHHPACMPPLAMYLVGYEYDNRFLEIYRSCYDGVQLATKFSIHKIYRKSSSDSYYTGDFTTDGAMTVREKAALNNKNIYTRFENLLGQGQTYMAPNDVLFNRGHLVPNVDLPFRELQRATFKMRNIVSQYDRVNKSNWSSLEKWIRRLVNIETRFRNWKVLTVCTGFLEVQQLQNQQTGIMTPIYLLNNKFPVPKWTYKIVSHLSGAKYVVLTYNDVYDTRQPDPQSICQILGCPSDLNLTGKGFTFCCRPYEFIRDNLRHLTGIC